VTWATYVPILVFLGLSVLELGPMYVTDRQMSHRRQTKASHNNLDVCMGCMYMDIRSTFTIKVMSRAHVRLDFIDIRDAVGGHISNCRRTVVLILLVYLEVLTKLPKLVRFDLTILFVASSRVELNRIRAHGFHAAFIQLDYQSINGLFYVADPLVLKCRRSSPCPLL